MSGKIAVHFVCDITNKSTGHTFQRGVTVDFTKETLELESGFDFILLSGIVEGKKAAARTSIQAPPQSVDDFESRVVAFQIMP
jgi:hypothetical protein